MVLSYMLAEDKDTLVQIKEGILRQAFNLGKDKELPPNPMFSLERMLGGLGVFGVGEKAGLGREVHSKYGVWTHDFIVLHSDKIDKKTHLLVGQPEYNWNFHSRLYELVVVTDPVKCVDDEELEVLRRLVQKLDADKGFNHIYNTERGHRYNVNRTIQLHQVLDEKTINEPDEAIAKILAIPPAYTAYLKYKEQKERKVDERINNIVEGLLSSKE